MEYFILSIAGLLRRSGISVSSQEISDCINLLKLAASDKINKYTFYNVLNTTMIKTPWGADYVLWLIELYFGPDFEISADRLGILSSGNNSAAEAARGGSTGKTVPLELLLEAVLNNKSELIYAAVKGLDLILELQVEDREKALEIFHLQSGWAEVKGIIDESYNNGKLSEADYLAARGVMEKWNHLLEDEIERQLKRNMSLDYLMQKMKKLNPRRVSFVDSDDSRLNQMSQEIQRIGRKLAIRKGRRRKAGRRGTINLPRTIRHSLKTGGIPLNLIKMQRKPSRPDLWLLCDMSNSVSKFIYFMLMFVYSIQKRYTNIRSFIFVDLLMEVTDFFKGHDWNNALRSIGTVRGYNLTSYSHYGNILQQFADNYLPCITKKTTVLISGDAKNNRNKLDGNEILAQIREKAAALYWLNPLSTNLWEKDDCIIRKYQANCTAVFPCSNIEELEQFISSI